jgi:type VI secretion system protein
MVTGMEAALRGILKRLDPGARFRAKIEAGGGISRLLKGKKALYWETYEKMYAEISDQATSDFHDIFSREFAEAYRQQLEKLKREDEAGGNNEVARGKMRVLG